MKKDSIRKRTSLLPPGEKAWQTRQQLLRKLESLHQYRALLAGFEISRLQKENERLRRHLSFLNNTLSICKKRLS